MVFDELAALEHRIHIGTEVFALYANMTVLGPGFTERILIVTLCGCALCSHFGQSVLSIGLPGSLSQLQGHDATAYRPER